MKSINRKVRRVPIVIGITQRTQSFAIYFIAFFAFYPFLA